MTRILGIETSCDETGVAILDERRRIVVNLVASQIDLHAKYGGVVPEIASRQHTRIITQLTEAALDQAGPGLDAVAATVGPGLMGSLLVGVNFAKAFAFARGLPFIPVHHIEGHIFSAGVDRDENPFPCLALIVSGGHTQLIDCPEPHRYTILGSTKDDAVGEAFDKVARLLGLGYPGGPAIQRMAETGDPEAIDFPRPARNSDSLDFSYSGLKTAVLYHVRAHGGVDVCQGQIADIAASFQEAAVDALVVKTQIALKQTRAPRLVVAGGVAANRRLRERLQSEVAVPVILPPLSLCIDNAAMIAAAGLSRWQHGHLGTLQTTPQSALSLL